MDVGRWVQCTPSEFSWERAALAYLRTLLPEKEPYRAWANAEFIGTDGSVNEIDLLLVTPRRLIVLEVKSWAGILVGDAGTWQQTHRAPVDNPVIGATRKARKLKSLLAAQPALRGKRVPWIEGAVFLSDASLDVRLKSEGLAHVFGRQDHEGLPSVLAHITEPGDDVDATMSTAIAKAVDQAGIRQSQRGRKVGSLRLEMPAMQEGPGWQDFVAHHERFKDDRPRRVRIYLAGEAEAGDRRAQLVRAAEREYRALRGIDYSGIASPIDFVEHDLGPALIFPHDPSLGRLDHFLQQEDAKLDLDARLSLLRTLAETISYAHRRTLAHRGLSPQCVWVRRDGDGFHLQVTDWQTATRGSESTTGASVSSTQTFAELAEEGATAYFAPEWAWGSQNGVPLDVFGVGAIAYLLFAGHPPASSFGALARRLLSQGCLSLRAQVDNVSDRLDTLVARATMADAAKRTQDMAAFLLDLDTLREQLTAETAEQVVAVDPLSAEAGAELEDGFRVVRRLGRGSTALALLVERDEKEAVLKVSLDPEKDARIRSEAAALALLGEHPGIVQLLDPDPLRVGGRLAILLTFAGRGTLTRELRERGRLQPEWLHDWGKDLLATVDYLERTGVAHRDIKPDNLGISEVGGKGKKRRLVLFDFSLSREPLEAVEAGTPPYLDPFLGRGDRRRWDTAAERYAAAVTLYEMATARRPTYGAGGGHPGYGDADVTIDSELFDRSYAVGLADFFRRALHRDARKRFDTAEDMQRAWDAVFAKPATVVPEQPTAQRVSRETPIGAVGLSPQVLAVLERLNAADVGAALDLPPAQLTWLPGIGTKTRERLRKELSDLTDQVAASTQERPTEPTLLDKVADALVPDSADRAVAEALLGLGETGGTAWASTRDASKALGRDQRTMRQAVQRLEDHWVGLDGMRVLRDVLVEVIESVGGVASAAHCAARLLDRLGSTVEEPLRSRLAEALVRVAIDAELADEHLDGDPRLVYSRQTHGILVAAGPLEVGEGPSTAERLEWASGLGEAADTMAAADPLPVPARVVETLREVPAPDGTDPSLLAPDRLVEVAALAAETAAVTPRLEIYPRGLDAGRAVRLAAGALYGVSELSPGEVAERVMARFPYAAPLPGRPELDALLESAGVPLVWNAEQSKYLARKPEGQGLTSVFLTTGRSTPQRASTGGTLSKADWRRVENAVVAADDRLARSLEDGGWVVLSVRPSRLARAEACLSHQEVNTVDVEREFLAGLRAYCKERRVKWDVVLAADAADRSSRDWSRLSSVVQGGALTRVREAIHEAGPCVVLTRAGVLTRYDPSLRVLDELRDEVFRATADSPVRTVWLVVPGPDDSPPKLDGVAVPVFGSQWMPLPEEWISKHESALREGGAA
ncbi:BREX system serine/threonine kinase PglW [Actinopolymorpha sp. NPDC004070]|uniref:BREX system serine/threonine kinase PglW n=1 Tax=Actinopolymorpha sp. NPDC004070 TaxID=3154548 RepID=UPI0033ACF59F